MITNENNTKKGSLENNDTKKTGSNLGFQRDIKDSKDKSNNGILPK